MRKENGKRESPYKGILKFADEKKPQLSFAVVLSVLSSAFGIVPYIAVAILLQKALASSLTTTWAILLPVIALCGYLLKHTLYAKSTLCSHILMIKQQHGYVRCVDVAEQLGVKKPSVSRAVKELIKSGHLVKNADGTLSLTELGLQIAEQIYEKHLFFTKQLILAGVDPETAEQDACGIEHAVSSESFQKLKKAFDDG